jgi:hypothetical protein
VACDSGLGAAGVSADVRRRALDAATRFGTAVVLLRHQAEHARNESERWLAGYEAEALLWKVLSDARLLVDVLNDEDSSDDEVQRQARALYEALRARRLARKLEQVEGRTPEEAAAFKEKARELRESST